MMRLSFRWRLVVLNSAVVFFILMLVGSLLIFTTRTFTLRSLDSDLLGRMERMRGGPPREGPGRLDGPGGPDGPNPGPPRFDGGPGRGGPGGPNGPQDPAKDDFERPLYFHLDGSSTDNRPKDVPLDAGAVKSATPQPAFSNVRILGKHLRVVTARVRRQGTDQLVLQLGKGLEDFERLFDIQTKILLGLTPLAMLVAGLTGGFLADRAIRPVARVTEAAAHISDKDLTTRLPIMGDDELGKLASTFNEMVERLNLSFSQRDLLNSQLQLALDEQKRFVADASHELRTPLARMKLVTTASLSQDSSVEELRDSMKVADTAAEAMSRLVTQLLVLARQDADGYQPDLKPIQVMNMLEDAVKTGSACSEITVRIEAAPDLRVAAESVDLTRAIANLVENACRYSPAGGEVIVRGGARNGAVEIQIVDRGPGISIEHMPHLTERFYRVDTSRARKDGGCGLGLAITKAIIERMEGRLIIESEVGKGTVCRVILKQI